MTTSYASRREVVLALSAFAELCNAQAIIAAHYGANPLRPTYCYLKPRYLSRDLPCFKAVVEDRP